MDIQTMNQRVPDEMWILILFLLLFLIAMALFLARGCRMGNLLV